MADVNTRTILELPESPAPLMGTERLETVNNGVSVSISASQVADLASTAISEIVVVDANRASDAADAAEVSSQIAQYSAGLVKDTEEGIASGKRFFSILSPSKKHVAMIYENVFGVAVDTGKRTPSEWLIESKVQEVTVTNRSVPVVVDSAGNVAVWLTDGKLEALGVGPTIMESMGLIEFTPFETDLIPLLVDDADKVAVWLNRGRLDALDFGPNLVSKMGFAGFDPYQPDRVPLVVDEDGRVPVWLDDGRIDSKGIGPGIAAAVEEIVGAAIEAQPVDLSSLLTTTGKTLWLNKAKRGLLNSGAQTQLKVMFAGDSWSDLDTIPNKMGELLAKDYPKIGYGWISALLNRMTNGVTATRAGWTLYDASATPLPPEFGCAFDGGSITTQSATAIVQIRDLPATKIVIYYRGGPGVFRYRVDGGAWAVTPNGTLGAREKIVIDGLSDAAHVLDIDTAGNSSSVTLYGFYATREASGYEILKCGRGGLRGGYAVKILPYIADYAADLEADLLIISLGTNDYRAGDVDGYIEGLTGMINKHREGRPDVGIVIIAPPDSNGVAAVPLTTIRGHGQQIASDMGCEFADIHSIFPVYAKSNALGLWADDLHLNASGADILCRHIFNKLMM